jgi:TolA-binding protein
VSRCPELGRAQAWAREGSREPLPAWLREHRLQCAACRQFVEQVEQTRQVFDSLPDAPLEAERVDAIRFNVMAEARKHAGAAAHGRHRPLQAPLLAAALVAAVLLALLSWPSREDGTGPRPPLAQVELRPGAEGAVEQSAPDEVYRLVHGRAAFRVRKLADGRRFRVVVGADSVEVRGTRFEVEASGGKLESVEVVEGRVVVRLEGKLAADLGAAERWVRPDRRQAAAAPRDVAGAAGPLRAARAEAASGRERRHSTEAPPSEPAAAGPHQDEAFRQAWALLQGGKPPEAADAFDRLSRAPGIDPGRRSDLLFWGARAHRAAGDEGAAEHALETLLEERPQAWHAGHAAVMMGEMLLEEGDVDGARHWLERAARSTNQTARARARALLAKLEAAEP